MIVDANKKPWLLEVNSSPALDLESDVDITVKTQLINDTLDLLAFQPPQEYLEARKCVAEKKRRIGEIKHCRRSSDIPFQIHSVFPELPRNSLRNARASMETVTLDCSQSVFLGENHRKIKGNGAVNRLKSGLNEAERGLQEMLDPKTRAKVEALTRTRPTYIPLEGRPVSCGLYELICPLTPVNPIQEAEVALLRLGSALIPAQAAQALHQCIVQLIS